MSEYPSTPSYSAGYDAREQQNHSYLPPTYPNPYLQTNNGSQQMASHYDASLSAYGYNRSVPSFSASAVAAGVPPLPIFQGWNQDPASLPPYTGPNGATRYSSFASSAQHGAPYYQTPGQPAYQHQLSGVQPSEEQGDVAEGEFEEPTSAAYNLSDEYGVSQYRENGGTVYSDTAQRAVYSRPTEHDSQQPAYPANNYNYQSRDPSQTRRQNSGSFSPHNAPTAAERDIPRLKNYNSYTPAQTAASPIGTSQKQYSWSQKGAGHTSLKPRPQINGDVLSLKLDDASRELKNSHQLSPTINGRSVSESRKKAQAAILNLWPYDVRYQTYIDEGFSKEVVGSLFDELKMTRNSPKTAKDGGSNSSTFVANDLMGKENLPSGSSNSIPAGEIASKKIESNGHGDERILSALGNNTLRNGDQQLPSANAVIAPTKPVVMTEKQKTLQSKMEALRKSREERAQKAAAKCINKPVSASIEVSKPLAEQSESSSAKTSHSPIPAPSVPIKKPQIDTKPSTSSTSTTSVSAQQQTSIIPGLFLASGSGTATSDTTAAVSSSTSSTIRKRPVAADFDEATPISIPYKRPFGQSRTDSRLVITVSEDEADSSDEDVAMELESQATQDSPLQLARKMSDHRSTTIQNLPPLSSVPSQKLYTPPPNASVANTPPKQAVPNTAGRLTHVQTEMEKLKKEIALREARQKAKQASSGSRTPQVSDENGSRATPSAASIASKVESSIRMQEMIETATSNVSLDQQRLADARAAAATKAAELKKGEDEQKSLRRAKLAADIPRVDAEVQQNQTRLEQLRDEMAQIEASVQRSLEDKRRLAEEMARLGQEAEEQLQAQKEKLDDIMVNDSTVSEGSSHPTSSNLETDKNEPAESGLCSELSTSIATPASPAKAGQPLLANDDTSNVEIVEPFNIDGTNSNLDDNTVLISVNFSSETFAEGKAQEGLKETTSTDHALEAALQEAVRAEVDSHGPQEDDTDMEDFYAPDPNQLAPQTPSQVPEQAGSPEYSPTLDRTMPDLPQTESDDYEPPEATPPLDDHSVSDSPPFSPAPPETVSEVVDDMNLDVYMPELEPALACDNVSQSRTEEILSCTNDSPRKVVEDHPKAVAETHLFTPYESPLKQFRAYRFHPNFNDEVPGGLKSKTYSHKIDVMNEFCRFELAGGICNDSTCDFQHFKDIDLPDDAVLTALGSPEDFKGEQRDQFCIGLRAVLSDLRKQKVRDFEVIASEIIAHRQKFLGDKSKILAVLEGTTI
ncbi:uncharacterized protein RAG0_07941 [Rhynchosporium agropyri]|uniref:Putative zinc-finger domain-containing protein n=1 Tax=Rhynchosporium agropyri TaxID=914238 RepID=A0A1E1KNN4_9HELO|nr:uncharacterized protein RAG0_07941 [Rhynchosporium agropyri]